jgi:hypothetical protein
MRALLIATCALTVVGCASTNGATSPSVVAGQSLATAWAALDAAALTADAAVKAGYLKGATAHQVAVDLQTAQSALTTATSAYTVSVGADIGAQLAAAAAATAEILTLTGASK